MRWLNEVCLWRCWTFNRSDLGVSVFLQRFITKSIFAWLKPAILQLHLQLRILWCSSITSSLSIISNSTNNSRNNTELSKHYSIPSFRSHINHLLLPILRIILWVNSENIAHRTFDTIYNNFQFIFSYINKSSVTSTITILLIQFCERTYRSYFRCYWIFIPFCLYKLIVCYFEFYKQYYKSMQTIL